MLTLSLGIGANAVIFGIVNGGAVEAAAVSGAGAADGDERFVCNGRADTGIDVAADYRKHAGQFQETMPVQSASFNYSGADRGR